MFATMWSRKGILFVLDVMLINSLITVVVPDLIATFSMNGVSGTVSFMDGGGSVEIMLDLQGFPADENYKWEIHNKAMFYDRVDPCNDIYIGDLHPAGNLTERHGLVNTQSNGQFTDNVLNLDGPDAVDGRTLVFEHETSGDRVCAQLIANADLITAIATIDTPFAGHVIWRQPRDDTAAVTTMNMEVYDIVNPLEVADYTWHIADNTGLNYDMTQEERCDSTDTSIYDPTNVGDNNCVEGDPSTCAVGDLKGKFGTVTVETVPNKIHEFFVDTNLPLTGNNGIIGKTLVFGNTQRDRFVCAQIRELLPKTVSVQFSANNVYGSMVFHQISPFDPTNITVDIKNLQNLASGYHVHEFPVPLKYYEDDQLASGDSVKGHFNPYGKDVTSPHYPWPGHGTNDEYEVGDISGKFGTLDGMNDFSGSYEDWNLPLFGKNSIVGRSVIIHKAIENERWIYGTIGYPSEEVYTMQSVFTTPIIGKIVLRQPKNDPLGDTSVWVEVAYADGSAATLDHNWHIHQVRVTNDYLSEDSRCSSTKGHDNPFNAEVSDSYEQCTPDSPGRCELGDLTGKLGTISVPAKVGDVTGKSFWTDSRLPLSGAYSVASKSIVIHAPDRGASRLACADLLEVPAMSAKALMWTIGPVTGDITLKQQYETDPTIVDSYVEGLAEQADGWHIHNLPVPYEEEIEPCSADSVQGHYNPFNIVGSPPTGTHDMYEVGDLSGKFTAFAGLDEYVEISSDTNLYLYGPRSVVGRSIVIHKDDEAGTRWVCATLEPELPGNAYTVVATATFTTESQIVGTIVFSQTHYGDENFGETTIVVDIDTTNAENSVEIEDSLTFDIRSGDEGCSPLGQIYNPYEVDSGDTYGDECDLRSQLRCQVGDLVGKHGEFSTGLNKDVYTDINLPLGGRASVLGHSLLIQSSTSDDSYTCATIAPHPDRGIGIKFGFPIEVEYESYDFRTQLDEALSEVELWNIVSTRAPSPDPEVEGCQSIIFYLIGPNQQDMKANFEEALKENMLGDYSPTELCEDIGSTASLISTSPHLVLFTTLISYTLYVLHTSY